jgi:hypothetical protein
MEALQEEMVGGSSSQPIYSIHILTRPSMVWTNIDLKVSSDVSADMKYENIVTSREDGSTLLKRIC